MKLFHKHTFDPEKWKLISEVEVASRRIMAGVAMEVSPMGVMRVWSNTCKECGDLIFRRSTEVE